MFMKYPVGLKSLFSGETAKKYRSSRGLSPKGDYKSLKMLAPCSGTGRKKFIFLTYGLPSSEDYPLKGTIKA
jgi:hypothetical protein